MIRILNDLNWTFHKLDNESVERVFASKTTDGFIIDSVYSDFNGATGLKVIATDDGGLQSMKEIFISLDQRNDTPVISSVDFDDAIALEDNYYHLSEDTVNIEFSLEFSDIDSDGELNNDPYTQ